ncbi:MAG: hypothetical protein II087_06605, partial [Muribaculaceae bacterium]|nr:hypothetical protein [Muribaculaceae bacterium]
PCLFYKAHFRSRSSPAERCCSEGPDLRTCGPKATLQFVDVLMDADSMMWSRTRKEHMGAWRLHFWAPDGPLNSALKQLNISAVPSVLVADSLGKVTYAGSNVKQAVDALKKLVP